MLGWIVIKYGKGPDGKVFKVYMYYQDAVDALKKDEIVQRVKIETIGETNHD